MLIFFSSEMSDFLEVKVISLLSIQDWNIELDKSQLEGHYAVIGAKGGDYLIDEYIFYLGLLGELVFPKLNF